MDDDALKQLLHREAARLDQEAPPLAVAQLWHQARLRSARRLHLIFNLVGWALRITAAAIVIQTAWSQPHLLPAAAAPILLLLWCSSDLVRRFPRSS